VFPCACGVLISAFLRDAILSSSPESSSAQGCTMILFAVAIGCRLPYPLFIEH